MCYGCCGPHAVHQVRLEYSLMQLCVYVSLVCLCKVCHCQRSLHVCMERHGRLLQQHGCDGSMSDVRHVCSAALHYCRFGGLGKEELVVGRAKKLKGN